jgi:uncharacterized protein
MAKEDAYRLIHACFNSLEQANILLEAEPSLLNERTGIGETPLHHLAVENQLEAVQFVHQQGADLNTCDDFGTTPLMSVVILGYRELVEYLLAHGADTSGFFNATGESVLHYAVRGRYKDVEILQKLIAAGASVTFRYNRDDTPLHLAVRENALEMAEVLILAGADVNARCYFSQTALHIAADEGMLEMSRLLLKYNADPSAVEDRGCTPADMAEDAGYTELADILKCRS